MVVSGPRGAFKSQIELALQNSKKKRKVKMKKSPRDRYEEKREDQYNVIDFEFLFNDLWETSRIRGNPYRWTMKEKGQMKRFINEFSSEEIVKLFKYVFKNWRDIAIRYRLNSKPSVSLIYGFRRSFFNELENDGPIHRSMHVQYRELKRERSSNARYDSSVDDFSSAYDMLNQ